MEPTVKSSGNPVPYLILAAVVTAVLLCIGVFHSGSMLPALLALASFAVFCWLAVASLRRVSSRLTLLEERARKSEAQLEKLLKEQTDLVNGEKIAAISKFASVSGHELKNPLASLKNIAYFLTKTNKSEDERVVKMLGMLNSEIDRTNDLINEFSNISRCRRVSKTATSVTDLTDEILSAFTSDGITVQKELEPVEAAVDPDRYRYVVRNLLTNARDAMPNGGTITVTLKKNDRAFELSVRDAGTGIAPETLGHIFEPMFSTKTKVLGLGLTVVKEIVNMHGGKIEVESEKEKGSIFRVTLPV